MNLKQLPEAKTLLTFMLAMPSLYMDDAITVWKYKRSLEALRLTCKMRPGQSRARNNNRILAHISRLRPAAEKAMHRAQQRQQRMAA